jgi:hypothetical protein
MCARVLTWGTFPTCPQAKGTLETCPTRCTAAILLLALVCGCTPLDLRDAFPWKRQDDEPQTPARMVDVWTDTILWQPGQPGVRGFGGRIMFYGEDDEHPVTVDGSLTVYAFDDEDPNPDKPPEKKYIFLPEQLSKHYSESSVGHSYSFWLPWDAVGGPERQLSLIARFEDRQGKVVTSEVAHKTLPGKKAVSQAADEGYAGPISRLDERATGEVRQAAHEEPLEMGAESPPPYRDRMITDTIPLTPSFARRLSAASDAEARAVSSVSIGRAGDAAIGSESASNPAGTTRHSQPGDSQAPGSPGTESQRAGSQRAESQAAWPQGSTDPPLARAEQGAPSTRFGRSRFRAPIAAADQPDGESAQTQSRPSRWPSPLPRTPRPSQFRRGEAKSPIEESVPD